MTSAKIILDSWNGSTRLTTMEVKFHRFILPEFNTHRAFSRNAASSRAIPVTKQIEAVRNDAAYPVFWGKNQSGMSAYEELTGTAYRDAISAWNRAKANAIREAEELVSVGLHKQLATRLLEPFLWTTMIVSFTESDNFFELRCPPGMVMDPQFPAQPEMQVLAIAMKKALDESDPFYLNEGEWHLPFIRPEDDDMTLPDKLKISSARCARVSYLTHDGTRDIKKDLELSERLTSSKHMSPFEHQARNMNNVLPYANFRGWQQLRRFIERRVLDEIN